MIKSIHNAKAMLVPGQMLGGYVIEQAVGRGAFGAVYRAWRQRDGSGPVALKVIERKGSMERFLMEPEILRGLVHPNIVRLRDFFIEDGTLVIAMEYVEGGTLEGYLRGRERLPVEEVRDLLDQLAHALDYAHRRGVLHRDLKPSNILVDRSGPTPRFVLVDFGVARLAEGIQLVRRVGGTYQFMAPEQLRGRAVAQSDLWALGVVAYRALSRRLPFDGENLGKLTHSVFYDTPLAPSRLGVEVSAELDGVILHLLEKQLENRTTTAAQLLADLGRVEPSAEVTQRTGGRTSWEEAVERTIRWNLLLGVALVLAAGFPSGLFSGMLRIIACLLTLTAYRRRGAWWYFVLALAAALAALAFGPRLTDLNISALRWSQAWWFWMISLSARFLMKASRLQQELALARSVRANAGAPLAMLEALESLLDKHPDDVTIHQRYVEALLSAGDPRQAAIEARLVLDADPYNMSAALTLAHAYFDLRLYEPCIHVCNTHLHVTGYGFELADLRHRAEALLWR